MGPRPPRHQTPALTTRRLSGCGVPLSSQGLFAPGRPDSEPAPPASGGAGRPRREYSRLAPTADPDNPYMQISTQAEREAAWPRLREMRRSLAETDIAEIFDAERRASSELGHESDIVKTLDAERGA